MTGAEPSVCSPSHICHEFVPPVACLPAEEAKEEEPEAAAPEYDASGFEGAPLPGAEATFDQYG